MILCIVPIFGHGVFLSSIVFLFSSFVHHSFESSSSICLIAMSIPQHAITILEETATPIIQGGERKAILLTI